MPKATSTVSRYCESCERDITIANWARHMRKLHPESVVARTIKGEQYLCNKCDQLVSRSQKARHNRLRHGSAVVPATTSPPSQVAQLSSNTHADHQQNTTSGSSVVDSLEARKLATEAAKNEVYARVHEQVESLRHAKSRLGYELPRYKEILERCKPGEPISYNEYVRTNWKDHEHDDLHRRKYVVCSTIEARKILETGSPAVPLVIPAASRPKIPTMLIEEYLMYLSTKPGIDVHTYNQPIDEEGEYLKPRSLSSEEAISMFHNKHAGPVNFLNLEAQKQNEVPKCLANIPAYTILRDLKELDQSGKRTEFQPADLSSCVAFQICGKADVFSLPHMDHHGVMTTITAEEGRKLWITWPKLQETELEEWANNDSDAPQPAPFALYLEQGDDMVQPAGIVHAPYSISDVLMSGTMSWDSRNMVQVIRQSILELHYPKITNEDPAKEFGAKLQNVERLWSLQHQAWPWGSAEELVKFSALLEVCSA